MDLLLVHLSSARTVSDYASALAWQSSLVRIERASLRHLEAFGEQVRLPLGLSLEVLFALRLSGEAHRQQKQGQEQA